MARAIQHPYFGHVVICTREDGSEHERHHPDHVLTQEETECCSWPMLVCEVDGAYVTCCNCGEQHALECEWPL